MMTPKPVRFVRKTVYEDLTPAQMVERYATGESLDGLGLITGTSSFRVRKVLVAHGVTIRPRFGHRQDGPSRYLSK
jgi:hypothetical protein